MLSIRTRVTTAALAATALMAMPLALGAAAPAAAASLGGIDVLPAKGNAQTPLSLITERGCAEPAERVSAVAIGKGLPEGGQVIVSPSEVLFSTTRPMELPVSNAFVIYADRNNTALQGAYTIKVRCTDRIGVTVLDEFTTTMTWTTPGGSRAKVEQATYTAKNTAGVLAALEKQRKAAEKQAAEQEAEQGGGSGSGSEATPGATPSEADDAPTGPRPGEQPLAGSELADGSNPGAAVDASSQPPGSGERNTLTTTVLLVLGAAALAVAGFLFLRGRSSTPTP
jgi:hypothetical protein